MIYPIRFLSNSCLFFTWFITCCLAGDTGAVVVARKHTDAAWHTKREKDRVSACLQNFQTSTRWSKQMTLPSQPPHASACSLFHEQVLLQKLLHAPVVKTLYWKHSWWKTSHSQRRGTRSFVESIWTTGLSSVFTLLRAMLSENSAGGLVGLRPHWKLRI